MLRIEDKQDEIVFREVPTTQWINTFIGALTVFLIVVFPVSMLTDDAGLKWLVFLLGPVSIFLLLLLPSPVITTKIGKHARTVSGRRP